MTSNGVESTRDFANRSSIIRIRKRIGHSYRTYPEGDLLSHVKANQPYYLGCVFSVIREWLEMGKQRTSVTEHDFREWARPLDWIVQNVFPGGSPSRRAPERAGAGEQSRPELLEAGGAGSSDGREAGGTIPRQ